MSTKELFRLESILETKRQPGKKPPRIQVIINCDGTREYCLQYAGNGKYFNNLSDLITHADKRWGLDIGDALREVIKEGNE